MQSKMTTHVASYMYDQIQQLPFETPYHHLDRPIQQTDLRHAVDLHRYNNKNINNTHYTFVTRYVQ